MYICSEYTTHKMRSFTKQNKQTLSTELTFLHPIPMVFCFSHQKHVLDCRTEIHLWVLGEMFHFGIFHQSRKQRQDYLIHAVRVNLPTLMHKKHSQTFVKKESHRNTPGRPLVNSNHRPQFCRDALGCSIEALNLPQIATCKKKLLLACVVFQLVMHYGK